MPRPIGVPLLLALIACLPICGCVRALKRSVVPPQEAATLDHRSPFLKVHARDGRVFVLSDWSVNDTAAVVSGRGNVFDVSRQMIGSGAFKVPIDSVALFETNVAEVHSSVRALTFLTGISAAITIYCLANPKACFGSCPTFYVRDGEHESLVAEGFSASVAPALEDRDIDALDRVRPRERRFELIMRNEALETHVVRYVHLLAAKRPDGGRVFATGDGTFWSSREVLAPERAIAPEGDCTRLLAERDGEERSSTADSVDLATRETIDLDFPAPSSQRTGVVIAARQSLLSTYVFYQSLAWMGSSAGTVLAALERGDPSVRSRAGAVARTLGGIEVLAQDRSGAWKPAGTLVETGPLATDVKIVPLPELDPGPVRIRLRMTRGLWRLDQVGLASIDARVDPIRLAPIRVLRSGTPDREALASLDHPGRALVTMRGDEYQIEFRLPQDFDRCELFLESRGYYLEWMRDEWLAEEDPRKALQLFVDPARSLRDMAPAFKKVEPEMESLFWGSRYAHP